MANKIVYILGAGFSAPLGLPVMSNFLEKAKDIHFISNPDSYVHFGKIFESIKEIAIAKNFAEFNLFNIEEILSFLEMESFCKGSNSIGEYKHFLAQVVNYYTPEFKWDRIKLNESSYPWDEGKNGLYILFIACLLNCRFKSSGGIGYLERKDNPANLYSIVTLNYDLVIEKAFDALTRNFTLINSFSKSFKMKSNDQEGSLSLAKLHGTSASPDFIVPPTWNKVRSEDQKGVWELAYKLISEANEIRIIGYSLPNSDNYFKFLLLSCFKNSKHLKKIDVMCMDPDGQVNRRYKDFLKFPNVRYNNMDFEVPLSKLRYKLSKPDKFPINFDFLEECHQNFMVNG